MRGSKFAQKGASIVAAMISPALLAVIILSGCSLLGLTLPGKNGPGAPSTPTGLAASGATSSSLTVSWNESTGATSYQLYRDTSTSGAFSTKVYDDSGTSFTDTGLSASTTYYYKVQATNADGSSSLSAAVSGKTVAGSGTVVQASDVSIATEWTAGNVYVVSGITVTAKLTIDPGVIVKIAADGSSITVNSGGSISAVGTSSNPIIFTSINDSSVGGTTPGSTGSPNVADWQMIDLNSMGSTFQYCTFSYSGYNGYAALYFENGMGNTTIDHSTFTHNAIGVDASGAGASTTITNNRFYANTGGGGVYYPLYIDTNVSLDDTNSFTDTSGGSPNTYQGIYATANGSAASWTWGATKAPYVINGLTLTKPLTINPGVIVKLADGGSSLTVNSGGKITAVGTSSAGSEITFTSVNDGTIGGTSSSTGSPNVADWQYIDLNNPGSTFQYCTFSYSGYNGYAALYFENGVGNTTIDHSTFTHNAIGVDASSAGASTTITNNRFYANTGGGGVYYPLHIDRNVSLDDTNSFTDTSGGNPNTYQGISVTTFGSAASWTWGATKAPYIVPGITLTVPLTINPGVVVKINADGSTLTVNSGGSIHAVGTSGAGGEITFTSVNDGTIGGTSSSTGSPNVADWQTVDLNSSGSTFQYCTFSFSGYNGYAAITIEGSGDATTITNCTFTNNTYGVDNTAGATVTGGGTNTYTNSGTSGGGYNP